MGSPVSSVVPISYRIYTDSYRQGKESNAGTGIGPPTTMPVTPHAQNKVTEDTKFSVFGVTTFAWKLPHHGNNGHT